MTETNPPGYPLPSGDLGEDEIVCQLVYLPNRPEYWQALLAAIHYFTTWRAWERDDDKRGKDAAANWREAFEHTMECWRMTCLDALLEELIAIRLLLSEQRDCCDIPFIYIDDDPIDPPVIDPGVGDPPETWGEEEVIETWEDWEGYVCYYANIYVDNLIGMAGSLAEYASLGIFAIMAIAGLLAIAASLGLIIAVSFPAAAGIVAGLLAGTTALTFLDTSDELEDARDSIVCAIMQNTGLGDAVEDALDSGLAWELFFQFLNYNQALEVIYTGEYDGQYLEPLTDETCVCVDPGEFDITFTYDDDEEEWHDWGSGSRGWHDAYGNPVGSLWFWNNNQTDSSWGLKGTELAEALGISVPTSFTIYEVHFEFMIRTQGSHVLKMLVKTVQQWIEGFASGETPFTWIPVSITEIDLTETNMNNDLVTFNHYGGSSTHYYCNLENVRIKGRWD